MRKEEALLINNIINKLGNKFTILNIGSSSFEFRNFQQPHVGQLYELLSKSNKVKHLDIKKDHGVDIVSNIFNNAERKLIDTSQFNFFLVSNLLEHLAIEDLNKFSIVIEEVTKNGDYLLLVQPYSYPIHYDPVDNYFRPNLFELTSIAGNKFSLIQSGYISSTTYFEDLIEGGLIFSLKNILKLFIPFYRLKAWKSNWHRVLWLFKPYKSVYCLLLKN